MVDSAELARYDPQELCRPCGAEGPAVAYHPSPVPYRQWQCSAHQGSLGEHLCLRCTRCGHTWIRAVTEEEDPMGIIKHGARDGQITGVEDTGAAGEGMGIRKEAARDWDEEAERDLDRESQEGGPTG